MTMENNFERLKAFHERGALVQGGWADAVWTACLMSALTGETSVEGCMSKGWPKWLAELGTVIFDAAPEDQAFDRAAAFSHAVKAAEDRGADWDRVFRDIRLTAILPITMEGIGECGEPWYVKGRAALQWSIDHDGEACPVSMVAEAYEGAWPFWAAWAAGVAVAAEAAGAMCGAGAATREAQNRIFHATIAALRGGG